MEQGRVVHGGRGRRHGDAKGIGGKAVGEGGVGEDAGAGLGERSGDGLFRRGVMLSAQALPTANRGFDRSFSFDQVQILRW